LIGLNNQKILNAKRERIDKQYYVDFSIIGGDVEDSIKDAEEFNAIVFDYLEKLNLEKINEIRKTFEKLIE